MRFWPFFEVWHPGRGRLLACHLLRKCLGNRCLRRQRDAVAKKCLPVPGKAALISTVIPVLERLKSVQKKFKYSLTRDIGFVILRSHTEINTSHMRTKTLLLTAALTAAGVATSMAQVYSVNMVGYINHTIPSGFSMLANQLNNSPDNKVVTLFPAPPEGTQVYKFDAQSDTFQFMQFADGMWEGDEGFADVAVGPGEGIWI